MVNPPKPGDASHHLYQEEKRSIIASLQRRARLVADAFNTMEGIDCQPIEGAMYSFPRITLSPAAVEAAAQRNLAPDAYYCMSLLDSTGIACVPGSGFNQLPGTWHFRIVILPPEEHMQSILERFRQFHSGFMSAHHTPVLTRSKL